MERMDDAAFPAWLAEAGISAPPGHRSPWLAFPGPAGVRRAWDSPADRAAVPAWLDRAVSAASPEGPWWLWQRGGGVWWTDGEPLPYRDSEFHRAASAASVPRGFAGALGFAAGEREALMELLRAWAAWEWNVNEDVYLVPGDRSCVVLFCHDEEIHAMFPVRRVPQPGQEEEGLAAAAPVQVVQPHAAAGHEPAAVGRRIGVRQPVGRRRLLPRGGEGARRGGEQEEGGCAAHAGLAWRGRLAGGEGRYPGHGSGARRTGVAGTPGERRLSREGCAPGGLRQRRARSEAEGSDGMHGRAGG